MKKPKPTLAEQLVQLKDLVIEYAKTQLTSPFAQLGRWIGYGVASAAAFALATTFLVLATIRGLQTEADVALSGNWSWVPYVAGIGVALLCAGLLWLTMQRAVKHRLNNSRSDQKASSR
jgi:hypothetical protein